MLVHLHKHATFCIQPAGAHKSTSMAVSIHAGALTSTLLAVSSLLVHPKACQFLYPARCRISTPVAVSSLLVPHTHTPMPVSNGGAPNFVGNTHVKFFLPHHLIFVPIIPKDRTNFHAFYPLSNMSLLSAQVHLVPTFLALSACSYILRVYIVQINLFIN